jgi:uncharacterized LabA/DUF88 family protein
MSVLKRRSKRSQVYAFIDSQNLNLGVQKVGWKMDWRAFRAYLKDNYNVTKAFLFIGYMAGNEALYEHMHELGYLVALKPTVDVATATTDATKTDDEPKMTVKGNIDADLVLYAMKELPNYDRAIIVSGDGDFVSLIEYLAEKHKLAQVMTPNWQYSSLLKPWDKYIIRIDQLRSQLAYKDYHQKRRHAKRSGSPAR